MAQPTEAWFMLQNVEGDGDLRAKSSSMDTTEWVLNASVLPNGHARTIVIYGIDV